MYQSISKREGFIIHPLKKNLKWGKICSYLASQAIYIGIWLENDCQHGSNFFWKKNFLDQIMMIWSIQTLKNVPRHFQTRGFHHTHSRKKSEMGQNLLIFDRSSNLYRDLAWKWLSAWVQYEQILPHFRFFSSVCMMKPSRLEML